MADDAAGEAPRDRDGGTDDGPAAFVRSYYETLRAGEPLSPYFADDPGVVKFGLSEELSGGAAVAEGLAEQSRRTVDWAVESRDLRATDRDGFATFADRVEMGWTDTEREIRFEFDTRWSGTLERVRDVDAGPGWRFVGMHVSTTEAF